MLADLVEGLAVETVGLRWIDGLLWLRATRATEPFVERQFVTVSLRQGEQLERSYYLAMQNETSLHL